MTAPANYSHQAGLFDPRRARKVTLIGAGSVGSHVAYALAKMGVTELEVWDGDTVASHNAPMSLYSPQDLGRSKVEALQEHLLRLTGVELAIHASMYDGAPLRNTSVVACVDTMAARTRIWEAVKMKPTIDCFIDTRTALWLSDIIAVAPCDAEDIQDYEALLYGDHQVARRSCGYHGVMPVALFAASVVATNLASYWTAGTCTWRVTKRCDALELASDQAA